MKSTSLRSLRSKSMIGAVALALATSGLVWSGAVASATPPPTLSISAAPAITSTFSASTTATGSMAFGDNTFVSLGVELSVLYNFPTLTATQYSTNGGPWTLGGVLPEGAQWAAIAYGDGAFVAVAAQSNEAAFSTDDGLTWTLATLPSTVNWSSIAYGNGMFVAVSATLSGAITAYSTDGGQTWTEGSMPVGSARWQAITYGDGMFVAVAEYTGDTAYSTDGVNWTLVTVPGEPWDGVTYGNGAFVAVSFSDHVSMHSTDAGQTWTEAATPPNEWNAVAYGDGEFVATPYVSQNAAYSTNGVNWSTTVLPGGNDWSSIAYGDGAFAAVASLTSYAAGIEFGAQASSTGNTFVATLDAPINATPTGSVTITDSANGTCTSGNWTDDGPDGNGLGGELYTATCAISSNESAGETMTATYSGADYSTLTSNETGIDDAPAITAATMTGTAGVGDVLTAGSSGVTGYPAPTESYQWLDSGVNITGATSSTYTVQTSDVGHVIAVAVTETNGLGSAATATSAASATVQGPPHGQPSTTTTTTPPMTTTTTPPTSPTPAQPSVKPGESNLGFSANSATLGAGARTALRALARKLGAGARVTITGYAKGNARLARARAVAAAAYLKRFAHVTVTISARTSSSNKVTVLTTTV